MRTLIYVVCLAATSSGWAAMRPARRPRARRISAGAVASNGPPVFLTRELGKNGKLRKLLQARNIPCDELPCIAFERLPAFTELASVVTAEKFGWIIITSPEAASVFVEAWEPSGCPEVSIACVGAATAKVLDDAGLHSKFMPSKATGKVLAQELPLQGAATVLYPCSALAGDAVESGLTKRGFSLRRIETYTTVPAVWNDEETRRAQHASVVSFASPSAVRMWQERAGTAATAVCIGETSAEEARRVGFERVLYPEAPGVSSWADTVASLGLWSVDFPAPTL